MTSEFRKSFISNGGFPLSDGRLKLLSSIPSIVYMFVSGLAPRPPGGELKFAPNNPWESIDAFGLPSLRSSQVLEARPDLLSSPSSLRRRCSIVENVECEGASA
jgi:hypothetical protein